MNGSRRVYFVRHRWPIDDSSGLGRCYLVFSGKRLCHAISGCAQMTSQDRDPYRESDKHGPFTVKQGQAYPPRIHYSKVESVASCRFQIDLCILVCVMSREFTREAVMKFLPAPFSISLDFREKPRRYFRLPGCCGLVFSKPSSGFEIRICLSSENSSIQDQTFFYNCFCNKCK